MTDPGTDLGRALIYAPEVAEACLLEGQDAALVLAIGLRETWLGWAPGYQPKGSPMGWGDGGHARGLFQIDDRGPYKHLPLEAPDATPFLQARWVCWILSDTSAELVRFASSPLFEVAVVAAYNAGSPRVARALRAGRHPDTVTTGGDYGTDVLLRRDRLRLADPVRFPAPGSGGVA